MAKRQIVRGKRRQMLRDLIQLQTELLEMSESIHEYRTVMEALRVEKKEKQIERNNLIKDLIIKRVPMKQIGENIGLSRVAIHLIKNE